MKRIGIVLILVAAALGAYWIYARQPGVKAHDHAHETYYCPMHPQIQSDRPGNCPICSMRLVRKDVSASGNDQLPTSPAQEPAAGVAPGSSDHAPVHLDHDQQSLIGLRTDIAAVRTIQKSIRTVGVVAHDPELYQLQTEYLSALRNLQQLGVDVSSDMRTSAERLKDSALMHLKHIGFNDELIREIEQTSEADHTLLFNHGGDVWIYASVYENELPFVEVKDEATIEVPALSDRVFPGVVRAFDVMVDPQTRTVRARVRVHDPEAQLKPAMNVNVTFAAHARQALSVPSTAIMDTGNQRIVFVEESPGHFVPRHVATGFSTGEWTEIIEGLKDGERVVIDGNFLLDSESRLRATLENVQGGSPEVSGKTQEGHGSSEE